MTILVVDDEEAIRTITKTILVHRGLTVVTAASGEEALQLCHQDNFDLILCDIRMPGMSGIEVANTVSRLWPSMGILLMTGYAGAGTRILHPYIEKPFTPNAIFNKVVEVAGALANGI